MLRDTEPVPLSRTSAFIFLVIADTYWLASFSERIPFVLSKVWLIVASLADLRLIFKISVVYAILTIPTWNSDLVPPGLWALALTTGPAIVLSTLAFAQKSGVPLPVLPFFNRSLFACSVLALTASLIIYGIEAAGLEEIQNATVGTAANLVPWNGWAIAAFDLFSIAGNVVYTIFLLRDKLLPLPAALIAALLLLFCASLVTPLSRKPELFYHWNLGYKPTM